MASDSLAIFVGSFVDYFKDKIQATNFLASGSLIATAFGGIATPLTLPFQCESYRLVPFITSLVKVAAASFLPAYF